MHGCYDELVALLGLLGYEVARTEDDDADSEAYRYNVRPPDGRRAIFLGDLVDRGPDTPGVLRVVMSMVESGVALAVPGNHDAKLVRALRGRNVKVAHGLERSLEQLSHERGYFRSQVRGFLDRLPPYYILDGGNLVVAHAGLKEEMQGRISPGVWSFVLYGETTGEVDELGLPVRLNWAEHYRGEAAVVYGHTPVFQPQWLNNTINIDTGCAMGGSLTALRWPERELVSVPAARQYYPTRRQFLPEAGDLPGGSD